jgi:hypothetical protein
MDTEFFEQQQPVAEVSVRTLTDLAQKARSLEVTIEDLEAALKTHKNELHHLRTQVIPDAMTSAGSATFATTDGIVITVDNFVSGSLPKDEEKRALAFAALKEAEGEGIIKDELTVVFKKSEHNMAMDVLESLKARGLDASIDSNVHSQTLMAFVRERLRDGKKIDAEAIGCFVGRIAKISTAKKKL